jgi:hypothetical protein
MKNKKLKIDQDLDDDLNEINTDQRNAELDGEILRDSEEISGMELRAITAGDLALLLDAGVGILLGKTTSLAFDVGAILFNQSRPKAEVRALYGKPGAFRERVIDFLDEYEPNVFQEATPRIIALVERMNKARTVAKGSVSPGPASPKAGGRAG